MPQVRETIVYTFGELNDAAKEKAREWFRTGDDFSYVAENVIEDAKAIAALMGIGIKNVFYSGFYSQGDGACFEGHYDYKAGSVKAVKDYAPLDKTLHQITKELAALQRKNFYKLSASVRQLGHYQHSDCTAIDVRKNGEYFFDTDDSYVRDSTHDGAELVRVLRKFMNWIYSQLNKQNDYWNEDTTVDGNISANDYTFTIDGKRFG